MVAKLKRESQFFQNVCKQERKCSAAHIRELRVELKKKADDLEATLQFQRELEYSLAEKEKETCQLRKQQREPQNPHTSYLYPSQFLRTRGSNRAPSRTINTQVIGSIPSPRKFYRKHEDEISSCESASTSLNLPPASTPVNSQSSFSSS